MDFIDLSALLSVNNRGFPKEAGLRHREHESSFHLGYRHLAPFQGPTCQKDKGLYLADTEHFLLAVDILRPGLCGCLGPFNSWELLLSMDTELDQSL